MAWRSTVQSNDCCRGICCGVIISMSLSPFTRKGGGGSEAAFFLASSSMLSVIAMNTLVRLEIIAKAS